MNRNVSRKPVVAAIAISVLLALGACASPVADQAPEPAAVGGQTLADLTSELESIDGLTFSRAQGSEPNIKGNTGFTIEVRLDPEYRLVAPEELVDHLTRSAWSVNDVSTPNTDVRIAYTGAPSDGVNLAETVRATGWLAPGAVVDASEDGGSTVAIPVADYAVDQGVPQNADRLGSWPGEVPPVPEDLVVPRSD